MGAEPQDRGLSAGARLVRQTLSAVARRLRRRPILTVNDGKLPFGMWLDYLVVPDATSVFVVGWVWDSELPAAELRLSTPGGRSVDLLPHVRRVPRPDIVDIFRRSGRPVPDSWPGFMGHVPLVAGSALSGFRLELRLESGESVGLPVALPPAIVDPWIGRRVLLQNSPPEMLADSTFFTAHLRPALGRLSAACHAAVDVRRTYDVGELPRSPDVSVVIPLYQDMGFLEHQLAQFSGDPDVLSSELVYVLDSPEFDRSLESQAWHLLELYRVPFRVVVMSRNVGYAAANSAGVRHASGRKLLLLNSDVLPVRRGWLRELSESYDARPGTGAIGPKLLYEDDSVQHAGLYFSREGNPTGMWFNQHYFKGVSRDHPAVNVERSVPGVTGACMMIARDLYDRMGGLSDDYVQGDCEDSDLCLRLLQAGLENRYVPRVEMYHLEGQSYPWDYRSKAGWYNHCLQDERWGEFIAKVMERFEAP